MRIGVIGTGRMAAPRADAIGRMDGAELAWVASRSRDTAERFVEEPPGIRGADALDDWRAAVTRDDTDAVIVTSPNALHHEMVKAALEAGKHALVEYPPTVTVGEIEELLDLSRSHGLQLRVGHTHRLGALQTELRSVLGSDELGAATAYIQMVCSGRPISRWYGKDDLSGGMFVASMYHMVDAAMDLLGQVDGVEAHYAASRHDDGLIDHDRAMATLRFSGECVAQIVYARGYPEPGLGSTRTILCERGYLIVEGGGTIRQLTPEGETAIAPIGRNATDADTEEFIRRIREDDDEDPSGRQGLETLKIVAEAARVAGV